MQRAVLAVILILQPGMPVLEVRMLLMLLSQRSPTLARPLLPHAQALLLQEGQPALGLAQVLKRSQRVMEAPYRPVCSEALMKCCYLCLI